MSGELIKNIDTYIQIIDKHDMYYENIINIDECDFLTPTLILPLITFSHAYNKEIKEHKNPSINNYFNTAMGMGEPKDTTFKIRKVDMIHDNSEELTNEILNVINPFKEMVNPLKFSFHEIIGNVYDHSKFNESFVFGQKYPNSNTNEFSFMDNGISIPGSFKKFNIPFKMIVMQLSKQSMENPLK